MSLFIRKIFALILLTLLGQAFSPAFGQWGAPYSNSWIKYDQPYVRIGITKKGVQKVAFASLPATFPTSTPDNLQLWHRGRQVAILSTSNNEIVFYAVPNDGATDSLLYRPMSSRLNPYTSIYSDESAYFLTVGKEKGLRAQVVNEPANSGITPTVFHKQTDVKAFSQEYSLSTLISIRADFFNSYFEKGASKTGVTSVGDSLSTYPIELKNRSLAIDEKPVVKFMLHGRSNSAKTISVYVGKNTESLRKITDIPSIGFVAALHTFSLEPADTDANGKGILAFRSTSSDTQTRNRFSLAYYTVSYPQELNMTNAKTYQFNLEAANAATSRLSISNAPSDITFYDITDNHLPKIIRGSSSNLMVPRTLGKALTLLGTSETATVAASKISMMDFTALDPKAYNYIILTTENLDAGAKQYAAYRSSKPGGGYKVLVMKIHDVYNEFNYGEPSPVGVRRFVDYMLSDKNRDKYLFLLGKSITFNERMIRELPNEVPSIGFPGSDLLLVEGLAGAPQDVPALPLGRLSALNNQHVADYLAKVIDYESNVSNEFGWQKKVLHLNGGKSSDEINQLKNILANLVPKVENGAIGGKVTSFVKQQGIAEVEKVNITPEVNAGIGLLTYFGHGSTTSTDLDFGYITDAAKGYNNAGKYPLMYFNGCGVGNIFSGRFNTNPSSGDRIALSLDWILAPDKGSVAIIANTFDTYVSSTSRYLTQLYTALFTEDSLAALSIGKIQAEVTRRVLGAGANYFDVTNAHQALLQGDPALHMIYVAKPDYAMDPNTGIMLYGEAGKTIGNSANLRTGLIISNKGRYNADQKIPLEVRYHYQDGSEKVVSQLINAISYQDTVFITVPNKQNLESIVAKIDPAATLSESNISNNVTELIVDWNVAAAQRIYPTEQVKDVVPPVLNVRFNGRQIENDEAVKPSPEITFLLTDDRLMSADTSLLDVFVKPCGDGTCDFVKISFADPKLTIQQSSDRAVTVKYNSDLAANGEYELLVIAQDKSGNTAADNYRIKFRIGDSTAVTAKIVASPNPASSYVKFRLDGYDVSRVTTLEYTVFDLRGVVQTSKSVNVSASGITEWYWQPQNAAGTYIYQIVLKTNDNTREKLAGRIQLIR
ncbi:putative type IX secretion system sortase PorU2 [Dyadobacter sandarakinus]|uniref:Cadherin domain-containing protein n=1 Tax=Dyadobacter sandarakinus TaxID=2747268 RepID=A0ABX7IBW5_9BACT|nr:C25 family cysteine peptidase [Dyadobacter sandarakinus]QRR03485.1 hypothetical protein HWI92_22510 [Dyadobacter sandarakinus]